MNTNNNNNNDNNGPPTPFGPPTIEITQHNNTDSHHVAAAVSTSSGQEAASLGQDEPTRSLLQNRQSIAGSDQPRNPQDTTRPPEHSSTDNTGEQAQTQPAPPTVPTGRPVALPRQAPMPGALPAEGVTPTQGDLERNADNPRPYCALELVSIPAVHYPYLVDIIAVQDHDEPKDEAWIYDFEYMANRGKPGVRQATFQDGSFSSSISAIAQELQARQESDLSSPVKTDKVDQWRTRIEPMVPITERLTPQVPEESPYFAMSQEPAPSVFDTLGDIAVGESPAHPNNGTGQDIKGKSTANTPTGDPPSLKPYRQLNPDPVTARQTLTGGNSSTDPLLRLDKKNISLRKSTDYDVLGRKPVNWLHQSQMLPAEVPGARVMTYSYPSFRQFQASAIGLDDFLTIVAEELLASIIRERQNDQFKHVPLLFIACGFGGLVVQKMLSLKEQRDRKDNQHRHSVLSLTAGILFIDTPYPSLMQDTKKKADKRWSQVPVYGSTRMRRIAEFLVDGQDKPVDTDALWRKFTLARPHHEHQSPIVWLYNKSKTNRRPPENGLVGVTFRPLISDKRHETERYYGPEDPNYREVLGHIKRFLLFKAAAHEKLDQLLEYLIDARFSPDMIDENGRTTLHMAASIPNYTGVMILINRGGASVNAKDSRGLTPLHTVVKRAVEINPRDERSQKPFKDVIQRILRKTLKIDLLDNDNKTPWDYAGTDDHYRWIKQLKAHRDLIQGPTITAISKPLEPLKQLAPDRLSVCKTFEGVLAEFFLEKQDSEKHEFINYETPSVYDMIYEAKKGPDRILSLSRPQGFKGRTRCRWMHLPANNEQWIHDLFVRLKIKDSSMVSQRHDGPNPFSRYMIPQAQRYKHSHSLQPRAPKQKAATLPTMRSGVFSPMSDDHTEFSSPRSLSDIDHMVPNINLALSPSSETDITPDSSPMPFNWVPSRTRGDKTATDLDAVMLFMPILGFELHGQRKIMSRAIHNLDNGLSKSAIRNTRKRDTPDIALLDAYLEGERPLHCRRTLDQFSYYMLETTERRDRDQVSYKWGRKNKSLDRSARPILMIDQLWLWALHNGTVITCFPNTWDPSRNREFDLRTKIEMELEQNKSRRPIRSAEELLHLILKQSLDFLHRTGPGGFKFQECFQSSINDIVEEHAKLLKGFRITTRILNKSDLDSKIRTEIIEELFQLMEETRLLTEIMDIQDELNIVRSVFIQQRDVLDKLLRICHRPEDEKERSDLSENTADKKTVQFSAIEQGAPVKSVSVLKNKALIESNMGIIQDNIMVVKEMTTYARNVQSEINHLLDLKQKQANAWEARFAREGSEQTQRQGNIMFVFTIVTIIFLPLSFIVSLVALPIREYPRYAEDSEEPGWPLREAFVYIFGIGTAILLPLMILAIGVNYLAELSTKTWNLMFGPKTHKINIPSKSGRNVKYDYLDSEVESDSDYESVISWLDEKPSDHFWSSAEEDEGAGGADATNLNADGLQKAKKSKRRRRELAHMTGRDGDEQDVASQPSDSMDPDFARLFGRYKFHTHIPVIRNLWRYESSRPLDDDFSLDSMNVYDYPLQRWRNKSKAVFAWPWSHGQNDYDFDQDFDRERTTLSAARKRNNSKRKRLMTFGRRGGEQSSRNNKNNNNNYKDNASMDFGSSVGAVAESGRLTAVHSSPRSFPGIGSTQGYTPPRVSSEAARTNTLDLMMVSPPEDTGNNGSGDEARPYMDHSNDDSDGIDEGMQGLQIQGVWPVPRRSRSQSRGQHDDVDTESDFDARRDLRGGRAVVLGGEEEAIGGYSSDNNGIDSDEEDERRRGRSGRGAGFPEPFRDVVGSRRPRSRSEGNGDGRV